MSQKHVSELAMEELEALDAIFAEALVIRPIGNNGAAVCEFTLPLNIPVPVRVQAGDREAILHRLPAAILRVAIPPGYPSDAPLVRIDAKYLTRRSRVRVAEALNELFVEGGLVLFEMAQFFQNDAWNLVREELGMRKVEGGGAVPIDIGLVLDDSENAERASDVLDSLLREEEAAIRRELDSARLPCCVCLVDQPGSMFHIMQACTHFSACKNCVSSFWEARIGDGQVSEKSLVCPVVGCAKAASVTEVKALVSNSVFEKFERFQLERAIGRMDDTVICRRATCDMPAARDSENPRLARCAYCGYNFCCECGMTWHGNELCSDLLNQYLKAESPSERVCSRLSCPSLLGLSTNVPRV
jgi:hypothetical protein